MFFIIPGLIVMAVTFLVPIYILKEGQGSMEVVSSNASLMKEYYVQVTLFLCAIWIVVVAIDYLAKLIIGFITMPNVLAHGVASALSLIVGLFTLPVIIALYSHLVAENNKAINSDEASVL